MNSTSSNSLEKPCCGSGEPLEKAPWLVLNNYILCICNVNLRLVEGLSAFIFTSDPGSNSAQGYHLGTVQLSLCGSLGPQSLTCSNLDCYSQISACLPRDNQ